VASSVPLALHLQKLCKKRALAKSNVRISRGKLKGYIKASSCCIYFHNPTQAKEADQFIFSFKENFLMQNQK